MAVLFVVAGLNHFRDPGFYLVMMPPQLPLPLELIYLSGVLEVLGGEGRAEPANLCFEFVVVRAGGEADDAKLLRKPIHNIERVRAD
jgi:hypothetical protein